MKTHTMLLNTKITLTPCENGIEIETHGSEKDFISFSNSILSQADFIRNEIGLNSVIDTLETAYLYMLSAPLSDSRSKNQAAFCKVRDMIAELTGKNPQEVQDHYEWVELKSRQK